MSETAILIRVDSHELDEHTVVTYYTHVCAALEGVAGFLGASFSRSITDHSKGLIFFHYESIEAADLGLKTIAQKRTLMESQVVGSAPADVMRLRIVKSGGTLKGTSGKPDFLSMSVRVAEPGYGKELVEELTRIFDELRMLDGFTGYLVGVNDTLEEEVIGIASWSSVEGFRASLPVGMPYEVRLYEHFM